MCLETENRYALELEEVEAEEVYDRGMCGRSELVRHMGFGKRSESSGPVVWFHTGSHSYSVLHASESMLKAPHR